MTDWRKIEKKAAIVLAIVGGLMIYFGYQKYDNPDAYFLNEGEWEEKRSKVRDKTFETILAPNQKTQVILPVDLYHITHPAGEVINWEAEGENQEGYTIVAHWRERQRRSNQIISTDWIPIRLNRVYLLDDVYGELRYTVTSTNDQPQAFRIGQYQHGRSHPGVYYFGYIDAGMCSLRGCEDMLTPASWRPTADSVQSDGQTLILQGIALLGLAAVFRIGLFTVLATIFPTATAQRVRAGLGTAGGYIGPSSNPFRRKQDLGDIKDLLTKTQQEIADLAAEEKKLETEDDADKKLAAELKASVARTKELSEKSRQARLRKRGPKV